MAKGKRVELNVATMSFEREGKVFEFNLDRESEVAKKLLLHGFAQKVVDSVAGMSESKGFTTEERLAKMQETADMLNSGEWSRKREGSGGVKISKDKWASLSEEQRKMVMALLEG